MFIFFGVAVISVSVSSFLFFSRSIFGAGSNYTSDEKLLQISQRVSYTVALFLFPLSLSFLGGIPLAVYIGKNLPTYQKKIAEEECVDESGNIFVIASYEPVFVKGKHNLIAIPTNNGVYGITKRVYQKK